MTLLSLTVASYASNIFIPSLREFELKADSFLNFNVHVKVGGIHWNPYFVITRDDEEVCTLKPTMQGNAWTSGEPFELWSAENPAVYDLLVYSGGLTGKQLLRKERFCFRNVEIDDNAPVINRKEVVLKAVNAPGISQSKSAEQMSSELKAMKDLNINTVRTNVEEDSLWYALCDRIGLYVSRKIDPDAPYWGTPESRSEELVYKYQPVKSWASEEDLAEGSISIFNGWDFTSLDNASLKWELLADGDCIQSGEKNDLKAAAQSIEKANLGYYITDFPKNKEVLLSLDYILKKPMATFPEGKTISMEQIALNSTWPHFKPTGGRIDVNQVGNDLVFDGKTAAGEKWMVSFNWKTGEVRSISVGGTELLASPIKPDFGMDVPDLRMAHFGLRPGCQVVVTYYSTKIGTVDLNYYVDADGTLEITQTLKNAVPQNNGMRFLMPESFETVDYYGNGPAMVQHYSRSLVEAQSFSKLRWFKLRDGSLKGLAIYCDAPFEVSAAPGTAVRVSDSGESTNFSFMVSPVL